MTLEAIPSATSLPGSASGAMPCDVPDGPTIDRSGPDPAPASHSALLESRRALPTNATSGRPGSTSSASAALQTLLASKLQARSTGSILYRLTWKERVTPSQRPICALRASPARMSDSGYTLQGWHTPIARDGDKLDATLPVIFRRMEQGREIGLAMQARMTGWPTPRSTDGEKNTRTPEGAIREIQRKGGPQDLTQGATLAVWPSSMEPSGPVRLCSDGTTLTGSSAAMASGGRLNPAHSRWLMRLPAEWDACAPTETRSTPKRQRSSS